MIQYLDPMIYNWLAYIIDGFVEVCSLDDTWFCIANVDSIMATLATHFYAIMSL